MLECDHHAYENYQYLKLGFKKIEVRTRIYNLKLNNLHRERNQRR